MVHVEKNNNLIFLKMMTASILTLFSYFLFFSEIDCRETVRGISPSQQPFYRPAKEFRCLDGSSIIPFDRVNDDYCDCADSTDEPGTSACPNGSYFCVNEGYRPQIIPSSRVNDGICDCCDTSDEYDRRIVCDNSCSVLGQQLQAEEAKNRELLVEGHKLYLDSCVQGQNALEEKHNRLLELEKERDEIDMKRVVLENSKKEFEEPENEAKERHKQAWEAEKQKRQEEKRAAKATEAFKDLDADQNNFISVAEFQSRIDFDVDADGQVTLDEVKEYTEEKEEIGFDDFLAKVWDKVHRIYRKPETEQNETFTKESAENSETVVVKPGEQDEERLYDEDGGDDDDDEGDNDDDANDNNDKDDEDKKEEKKENDDEDDIPMPEYDEATQQLIAAADVARKEYNDVDSRFRDIEREVGDIKKLLEFDLGPNKEFYPLKGRCFDFSDREYIYSLCPFERASQRNKNGGTDMSLGTWGSWAGPLGGFKYAVMKYEHGQNCWSGPDRSATVDVRCGIESELVAVSEPNRCEYHFVFNTPAVCHREPEDPTTTLPPHAEL